MNPQTIKIIAALFSMKQEIKTLFFVVIAICLLPIFAVIILTQEGIDIISGALVTWNPQTAQVEIHDPRTGDVVYTVDSKVVWPVGGPISLEFGKFSPLISNSKLNT